MEKSKENLADRRLAKDRVGSKWNIILCASLKCLTVDQRAAGVYLLIGTVYECTGFTINCRVYYIFH